MNIDNMSNSDIISKVFVMWGLTPKNEMPIVTENEDDFICKIIFKRTKTYGIKIPLYLGYIISLCSNGNPGFAIVMYYNILQKIKENKGLIPKGYMISTEDFANVYPVSFPNTDIPEERSKLEKMWDEQKDERGNNKVDAYSYWSQLFEED